MNGANQDSHAPAVKIASPVQNSPQPQPGSTGNDTPKLNADAQKLASAIRENRLKLDQGWCEVQRLNQALLALDEKLKAIPEMPRCREMAISQAA